MNKYLVSTGRGGVEIEVTANDFQCSANGLKFTKDNEIVAWFLSWDWFIRIAKEGPAPHNPLAT